MQTMNISLPEPLKDFIEKQVSSGRYSSVSEYVRELVRADEKQKAQESLEQFLLHGLQNGKPTEMTLDDWKEIRQEAMAQVKARRSIKQQ